MDDSRELRAYEAYCRYCRAGDLLHEVVNAERDKHKKDFEKKRSSPRFVEEHHPNITRLKLEAMRDWCLTGGAHPAGDLAYELGSALAEFLDGHEPRLFQVSVEKPGRQALTPIARSMQIEAAQYVLATKSGEIEDPTPTKTIADAYGVTNRTVQNWVKKYGEEVSNRVLHPFLKTLIVSNGRHYRVHQPKQQKAHG